MSDYSFKSGIAATQHPPGTCMLWPVALAGQRGLLTVGDLQGTQRDALMGSAVGADMGCTLFWAELGLPVARGPVVWRPGWNRSSPGTLPARCSRAGVWPSQEWHEAQLGCFSRRASKHRARVFATLVQPGRAHAGWSSCDTRLLAVSRLTWEEGKGLGSMVHWPGCGDGFAAGVRKIRRLFQGAGMTSLVPVLFLNLLLYRRKRDQCVQTCVYRFSRVNSVWWRDVRTACFLACSAWLQLAWAQGLCVPGLLSLRRAAWRLETRGCLCAFRPVAAARKESDKVLLLCFCPTLKATLGFL